MQYLFLYLSAIDAVFGNIFVFLCDIIYKRMTKKLRKSGERVENMGGDLCFV